MNGEPMSRLLTTRRVAAVCATVLACLAIPAAASAGSADLAAHVTLFPSNALTVHDFFQITGRRVNLPMPDCTTHPTDCNTVAQLNQLDGFDIDPRLALTFDAPVDPADVAARTTVTRVGFGHPAPIGVDRVV